MSANLFDLVRLGDLPLANRMVMAPMTRNRSDRDGLVSSAMILHYQQRATAGLIIAESTTVSPGAVGYPSTPGLHTQTQTASWLRLTDAVHSSGGRVFAQLQHCGRISHPSLQPDGALPVAPSAVRPNGQAVTYSSLQDFVMPRTLAANELPDIVADFRRAAGFAKQAGFDGVEVHGANGYLIDQFLRDGSNLRTDAYGGSPQNRMRLLNEILDAVCEIWPADRVGLRLSPENGFNTMSDSDPHSHFAYFASQLGGRRLAYLHVLEGDMATGRREIDYRALRAKFTGPYIANNGYNRERGQAALLSGAADLVAYGVPFLANPDLVRRYRENLPLNGADPTTFYGGDETGYTDYPFYVGERDVAA